MFDSVTLEPHHPFYSTSLQDSSLRAPSPRPENGTSPRLLENHLPYDLLFKEATKMQTRINELDVINSLFRGRIEELENAKEEVRRQGIAAQESEHAARSELAAALSREVELKRRIEELESESGPRAKRIKMSDFVEDRSQASTPASTKS
jgi:chromosome segregation ATPase